MELSSDLEHPLVAVIERLKYLRTVEIPPVFGNLLELRIGGAEVLNDPHTVAGIEDVRSLETPEKSDVYSFIFRNFVSYSVTDEMFIQSATDDVFEGGRIRIYSQCHFLRFVAGTTWATSHFPGPLLHYQLNTLDHTIDIVTAESPKLVVKQGQD